jgi:hypothetical protein
MIEARPAVGPLCFCPSKEGTMTKVCDQCHNPDETANEGISSAPPDQELDPSFLTILDLSLISPRDKTIHLDRTSKQRDQPIGLKYPQVERTQSTLHDSQRETQSS